MPAVSELRPSPIAGTWYPGDPQRLASQVDAYLDEARLPQIEGDVIAVIAPHAGYIYSGPTAGYAFASVRGKEFSRVVLLSPLHGYHPAPFITSAHNGYQTPLGPVWIDFEALSALDEELDAQGLPGLDPVMHDKEHSLEIELPFLQRALSGEFRLLPIMVRSHDPAQLYKLGQALAKIVSRYPALLVASTDLSHFFPLEIANQLDEYMLQKIVELSPQKALLAEETGTGFACGVGGVAAALWAALTMGANGAQILHHSTSADQTGDESSVVGYGAAVVLKKA
jgi:AmmeMemoRadiSam system protein B